MSSVTHREHRSDRREQLVDGTISYLLDRGLVGLSLRPLAKALGTSDRMLLYYFSTRDEIVEEALGRVGTTLQGIFESALAGTGASPAAVVEAVVSEMVDPVIRSHLQLWVEMVALAGRGDPACERVVASVTEHWTATLQSLLAVPTTESAMSAAAVIAIVEGLALLQISDRDDLVHATRRYLSASFPERTARVTRRRGGEQTA